ncbi:unnamed protein product [Moneuplotes crassus]|uniref:Uncharacterized protein n=1 Tax=Euplotes crassus TaxID=5936 RepID=A0AAD1UL81_EUPCR|nr:unnamed protein product [Moneuplotes crassus]
MDRDQSAGFSKRSKPKHYFPQDFFGDELQGSNRLMLPNFRRKRRQVKSVDAAKDAVVKNSQEFATPSREVSESLHIRRNSQREYKLYQTPKVFSINPGNFLRRNLSEQKDSNLEFKRSARNLYSKPLSLMASMKRIELGLEGQVSTDSKPKAAKNLMKFYPEIHSFSAMKPEEAKKRVFFSKRRRLHLDDLPQSLEVGPGVFQFQESRDLSKIVKNARRNRKIILPNLNDKRVPKVSLKNNLEMGTTTSSPNIPIADFKSASIKVPSDMLFLSKCEKGIFKPCGPLSNLKNCTNEDMGRTAYFGE